MVNKKRLLIVGIAALYLITWIGGWSKHAQTIATDGQRQYEFCKHRNEEEIAMSRQTGEKPHLIQIPQDGPETGVNWATPVLPGVLVVNHYSFCGPLGSHGGTELVAYYGFGEFKLFRMVWMS
jgi:hypothetical protein